VGYFDIGVYIFLAIAALILMGAAVVVYRSKKENSTGVETESTTPLLVPLLAIATSGLALVFIKYVLSSF
jgi:uncharacterized membrane protein|tara:strand:- start:695 stop:904 length:210 start_codon:yes stop_codon:yes gene_type:complete